MCSASMGFLADIKPGRKRKIKMAPQGGEIDSSEALIRFDSGRAITFQDVRQHILVFGTTGSGKTVCVILPAALSAIRAGHAMILGDIKGNMGDAVRKMAAACGRYGDVAEYGCGPLARRVNLLAWMGDDGIRRFFENLVDDCCPSRDSKIWARKGAVMAADIAILLRLMAEGKRALAGSGLDRPAG